LTGVIDWFLSFLVCLSY